MPPIDQITLALGVIEQQVQTVAAAVRYSHHQVGVHHVVNQRNVLVANALDVVLSKAVGEQRRTLCRFDRHDPRSVLLL